MKPLLNPFATVGEGALSQFSSISTKYRRRGVCVEFMNLHIYASFYEELGVLFGELHHYSISFFISCTFT